MKSKKKILTVFGTRPEATKMAPIVKALRANDAFESRVCVTAQHREMLDQVLTLFSVEPDFDLNLMKAEQSLVDIANGVLNGVTKVLDTFSPDLVLVHGDTATTLNASLAAFYKKIPVGHVEAGLRTGNIHSPWPEEMNRRLVGSLASYHFAPSTTNLQNLLDENVSAENVVVTGNTVIDALKLGLSLIADGKKCRNDISKLSDAIGSGENLILVTAHRRENVGEGLKNIIESLRQIAAAYQHYKIVWPVHLNPGISDHVRGSLTDIKNIILTPPLEYFPFIWLMNQAKFILTDSGGIQEEAPSLGKPVLVMRDTTERTEAVSAGTVMLVGTDPQKILEAVNCLVTDQRFYNSMAEAENPYGNGNASDKIISFIAEKLKQ